MTSTTTDRRDGFNTSAAIKVACRCATTANVTLSGYQTIDGILPTSSDSVNRRRVFVKSQTTASENGIYIMDTGTWSRANDFDSNRDLVQGTLIPVNEGTTLGGSVWRVTNTGTITIGTTSLTFERAYVSNSDSQTFLQAGTGAVSRTVQSKLRDVVNVKDFGAVGDGSTDDTTAFTNALAALPSGGGLVVVPSGSYKVTSSITLSHRQGLVGEGASSDTGAVGGTRILKNGNFDGIVLNGYGCILRDLTCHGDSGNGGDGIYVRYGHADIQNVASNTHGGAGWRFGDKTAASANTNHCTVIGAKAVGNTGRGFYLNDANAAANVNACWFSQIDTRSNGGDGIEIGNAYDNTFVMLTAQLNTGTGVQGASGCKGNLFLFPYTESNGTEGVFDAGSIENTVIHFRQGTDESWTDNGTRNTLTARDYSKQGDLIWRKMWMNEAYISNASYTGHLKFHQTFGDQYDFSADNGTTSAQVRFRNLISSGLMHVATSGRVHIYDGTGAPAGGTAGLGLKFTDVTNFGVFFGTGAPTLSAAQGSLYMRRDGTTTNNRMYVNTDGATAWASVTTSS